MQEVARAGTQVEVHRQHVALLEECWTSQEAAKARAQRMKDLTASAILLEAGVASTSEAILQHSAEAGEADELVSRAVGRAAEMRSAGDETSAGVCNQEANKWRAAAAQARHEVQVTLSLQWIRLCAQKRSNSAPVTFHTNNNVSFHRNRYAVFGDAKSRYPASWKNFITSLYTDDL